MGDQAPPAAFLRNHYWVLRHGKSIANEKGLIVSSMENGVLPEFSLVVEGIDQANFAGEAFCKELQLRKAMTENVRICYSPFSRTCHTAKQVANALGIPFDGHQCKVIHELRERYFGPTFELKSHDKYAEIWAHDEKNPFVPPEGGESVADVVSRLASALNIIETDYQGCIILVVSHGDPLQMLQAVLHAAKQSADMEKNKHDVIATIKDVTTSSVLSQHRKFALNTGELREVV